MIEGLTVYNYYVEMIVLVAIFMFPVERKNKFWLRSILSLLQVAAIWYVMLFVIPDTWLWLNIIKYILLFGAITAAVWGIWKVDFGQACYISVSVYAVQHIVVKINVMARLLIGMFGTSDLIWLYYIVTPVCFAAAYFAIFKPLRQYSLKFDSIFQIIMASLLLVVTTFISLAFDWDFCGGIFRVLLAFTFCDIFCTVLVLVVQFCTFRTSKKDSEIAEIERIRRFEKQQYSMTQDLIERINIKSHDLKHQLMNNGMVSEEEKKETLAAISLYDGLPRTGNTALDTVLISKKPTLDRHDIVFTCIAEAKLDFIKTPDIYSLFGNILDNAIEANAALPEGGRYCVLVVKPIGDNISIHEENEYAGVLKREFAGGGVLVSTKKDKYSHGFGLKSIASIVKKYGGQFVINTDENVFTLDILIPAEQSYNK